MVGNHLGNALVALQGSMQEFRDAGVDNKRDLLSYLDEEGYLDTRHQPNHALAILHVAENFELRDLYIDAFAHCVGMSEQLYRSPEYSRISVVSRKLIRLARVDLDNRLSRAGAMLGDLLETELSEAHLGLSTGARAHLDRFRNYIQGFYTTKFGYFPPPPAQGGHSTVFKPELYNTLKADFEALYEYLVDERFTTAGNSPFEAQGGLCTLQSVQAFDSRNKFSPLEHPLPLLPETPRSKESRRMSMPWQLVAAARAGDGKLRPDQRLVVHAALMKATNHTKVHLMENRLVLAYRQFEESSVLTSHKANRSVSQVDARKEDLDVLPDIKEASKPTPSLKVVTTPSTTTCRSASTSSTSSYVSALSSASTSHTNSSASTTPTTMDGSPSSTRFSRQKWDTTLPDIAGSPEAPATVPADISTQQRQQPSPPQYDSLTFPIRRHRTRKSIRAMHSSDDMLASTPKAEPPPPLPRRSSKRFRKPSGGPSKRWSLAEVVSSLRERSSAADSDAEDSDDAWGLAPSPLRITKTIRRPGTSSSRQAVAAATKNGGGGGDGEDGDAVFAEQRRDSSDEWEKSVVHSPVDGDVSPPWAWEQFADLGGLQDVSGLK
ncbi:hypothetical protein INS49_005759 [Diaporthe citri]|uniref:uncharacterized protein n=1 Tax=Diaporthe citri TaxID=83186 RepID=UPI001C802931|nr:uncharacterized protein INS49_005759 [Diaporthe citri]KAG6364161.1 hypothetical protein INS49_005759 [Diaporthe citri]